MCTFKNIIVILLTVFLFHIADAQNVIEGTIKDTNNIPLCRINVLIYKIPTNDLVSFAVSDENGYFKTNIKTEGDSLFLEINSLLYKKEIVKIANKSQALVFNLKPDVKQLETVLIKAPPIERKSDTITYLVNSFAKKQDRTIEDVLKRMPGIEVESDGKILYQGVPIQKFYVEGLDLMNGRYSMVSKNLPGNAVGTVEVLENYQPLKILQGRVASVQPSLNLKLKRKVTVTGTAKIASGLSPFLWDINFTPMIFNKKIQLLASYQTNNTGNNISRQLDRLSFQEIINRNNYPAENTDLLNIIEVPSIDISQKRYLNNRIHLINFNNLLKMSNDLNFRSNIFYVNNFEQEKAISLHTIYSPADTISFNESYDNKNREQYLSADFSINRNTKNNYLENVFKIKIKWNDDMGMINRNSEIIDQQLYSPVQKFSNSLYSVIPSGKHLITYRSYISIDNNRQILNVYPGQFNILLNNGNDYKKTSQIYYLKRFFTENSFGRIIEYKSLLISPKIGFTYRRQLLETEVYIVDSTTQKLTKGFVNKIDGRHYRIYFNTGIQFRIGRFTVNSFVPLSWQIFYLNNLYSDYSDNLNKVFFAPSIAVYYKFVRYWRIRGSWIYNNDVQEINSLHDGFIFYNYRTIRQNAIPLTVSSSQSYAFYISYRNPVTTLFGNLGYNFSYNLSDYMYGYFINDDGSTVTVSYLKKNRNKSHNINFRISFLIPKLKSTFRLKAKATVYIGKSLVNDDLFNNKTVVYSIVPGANIRLTDFLNLDYSFSAEYINSYVETHQKEFVSVIKHNVNLFAFPFKDHMFGLNFEQYLIEGSNGYFLDAEYRFTFSKRKVDVEFHWNNILNEKEYVFYKAFPFNTIKSTYYLRPSQILVSVKFGLR